MKSKITGTNKNEAQWVVDVFLYKRERQQLLMYLSMDTARAGFRGEVNYRTVWGKDIAQFIVNAKNGLFPEIH